jgi:hypothetical protein
MREGAYNMAEVIILRGGTYYYIDDRGIRRDTSHICPEEHIESLRLFIGKPINNLGSFPDVDSSSIVQDIQIKDNTIVAFV